MSGDLLYMDAGVLINLCATQRGEEILREIPYRCAVIAAMEEMPLFLWTEPPEKKEQQHHPEPIPLTTLVNAGVLELHTFQMDQCCRPFVAFAAYFNDLQAMMLALSVSAKATFATDDKRIRRMLRQLAPEQPVISTLNLLQTWQMLRQFSFTEMQMLIEQIAKQAHFLPSEDDSLYSWWTSLAK